MSTFKQILCAIDLSELSEKLLEKAKYFAQNANTALAVLHVVEDSQLGLLNFMLRTEDDSTEKSAIAKLNAELLEIKSTLLNEGIKANTIIKKGKVSESIHHFSNEINADLMLIGAYSHNVLQNLFLGSTALKILRQSVCPTLVVKNESLSTYQRVLIGVDFSQDVSTTISVVKNIAPNAEIVLAHFYDIPFEGILNHYAELDDKQLVSYRTEIRENALKKMESIANAANLSPLTSSIVVVQGDAVEQILFFAKDYDCDLLVLGKHGKNLTEEFLIGSVTNEIINTCGQDVLVMTHQANR